MQPTAQSDFQIQQKTQTQDDFQIQPQSQASSQEYQSGGEYQTQTKKPSFDLQNMMNRMSSFSKSQNSQKSSSSSSSSSSSTKSTMLNPFMNANANSMQNKQQSVDNSMMNSMNTNMNTNNKNNNMNSMNNKNFMGNNQNQNQFQVQSQQKIFNMNAPCTNVEFGTILPHPENDNQFVICYSSDEFTIMDCPEDLVYNPFLERCDHSTQMPTDPCSSAPCHNNGQCMQQQGGLLQCKCAPGFTGEFCDTKNSCLMKNCGTSDGTCVELAVGSPLPNVCRCAGGQAYGLTCTGALEANPCTQQNSQGIMFSTRLDPAVYVHCSGNKPHFQFCQTGLAFNMNRQYCDWSAQ